MQSPTVKRILRLPSVQVRTGLSRSTIYLRIAEGSFPKQISLGARAIGWIESDIDDWIDGLLVQSGHSCSLRSHDPIPDNSEQCVATEFVCQKDDVPLRRRCRSQIREPHPAGTTARAQTGSSLRVQRNR